MIGVVAVAAMIAGLIPALRAAASPALAALAETSLRNIGSYRERKTRQVLVSAQVALSLVLLGFAGLVLSSMQRLNRTDPGFDARGVLTLQLAPPARYPDAQARANFLERVLARISEIPEVQAAGSTQTTFEPNSTMTTRAEIAGQLAESGALAQVNIRHVTAGYFDAMRVRVIDGRPIDSRDRIGTLMAAVVSQSFASRFWPGQHPVGQRVRRVGSAGNGPWMTVVGVVGDVMDNGLGDDLGPTLFVPYLQQNTPTARISLTIRDQVRPSRRCQHRSPCRVVHRSHSADRRSAGVGRRSRGVGCSTQVPDRADGNLRLVRIGPRLHRCLQCCRVLGTAAHPRDRRAHGSWRGPPGSDTRPP